MSPDHFFPFISGHETNAKPLLSDLLLNILVTYSVKKKVTYQLSSVGAGRGRDGDPFFSHRPEVRLWGNSSLSEQSSSMSLRSYHDTELSAHQIVDIRTLVCPFLSNPSKLVVPNLVDDRHQQNCVISVIVLLISYVSSSSRFIPWHKRCSQWEKRLVFLNETCGALVVFFNLHRSCCEHMDRGKD